MLERRQFFKALAASAFAVGVLPIGFPTGQTQTLYGGPAGGTMDMVGLWARKFFAEYQAQSQFQKVFGNDMG